MSEQMRPELLVQTGRRRWVEQRMWRSAYVDETGKIIGSVSKPLGSDDWRAVANSLPLGDFIDEFSAMRAVEKAA